MNSLYLPEYFTLTELTKTSHRYFTNKPGFREVVNLADLCENVLDPLRKILDRPIVVNSGFRCEELNRSLAGASPNSYHLRGMAADICCHDLKPIEVFKVIKEKLPFTELGLYYSFVHVAYDKNHLFYETFCKVK